MSQQVKVKPYLGHYDKNVLNHIIPIEACDILSRQPRNFHNIVVYQGSFNKITFTSKWHNYVASFSIPSQVVENRLQNF